MRCDRCPARPCSHKKECCKNCIERDMKALLLRRCSDVFKEPMKIEKEAKA